MEQPRNSTTLAGEYLRRDDHTVFLLPCAPNEAVKTGSGSDLRAICIPEVISQIEFNHKIFRRVCNVTLFGSLRYAAYLIKARRKLST